MKKSKILTKNENMFVFDQLSRLITNPVTELNYTNNFQLIVAVILSAQCTDKRVNIITKDLFEKYLTPQCLANANQEDVEKIIHSCGFFRNKAKNIILASKDIVERFGGVVPDNLEDLTTLAGVGRKTANVVLSVAFNIPTVPVDTHVFRVSNRIGLVSAKNPVETEKGLSAAFDSNLWNKLHHLLILFGRYYCTARSPKCEGCVLSSVCLYYKSLQLKNQLEK